MIKKIIFAVIIIGGLAAGGFGYFIYNSFFISNTDFSSATETIFVRTGSSFDDVMKTLKPLLKNDDSFTKVAAQKNYVNNVKAGRYILKKGMNNNEIVNTLRSKNLPIKVSFNNQERVENLAGRIAQQIEADSISLLEAFTDKIFLTENNLSKKNIISIFIPNTYEFYWNTSAQQFRNRMLKEYNNFWNKERIKKANKQGFTPTEIINLASIVQKETVKIDERPRVAGVYLNRLKKGMLLQADPTVIFAIKEHTGNYDTIIKRVLYKDLEINSLYNTYKYEGLPPGPIAMPDISSIEAVLNPEIHDYYYFVADTEKIGYHKFARTLQQHNQNSEQYHQWIKKQGIKR